MKMKLFHPGNQNKSPNHQRVHALSEIAYTCVDFSAAVLFVIGSYFFLKEIETNLANWCFLIGSIFFGLRPTIKLVRELCYINLKQPNSTKEQE